MREKDIVHENGKFWVLRDKGAYSVMKSGVTHSEGDSSYALTEDGLSIAIARCDYLAGRAETTELVGFAKTLHFYMTEASAWLLEERREYIQRVIVKKLVVGLSDMAKWSPECAAEPDSVELKQMYTEGLAFFTKKGFAADGQN
ncbi:TPA: hypothetical protein SMO99_003009 [Proteus mirabilis]|uniref:Uncharacterized protein n=2 Tax=Morganellaceae TaxID=1903414 RepID=A0AAI9MTW2_MORMO|nr:MULTISPECIES: hypothetical protein [Providencia]EJV1664328.1 hypothetical protein [Klebsiella pneumoniae]EKW8762782.1 hypothetical protein [Morganella morganii]THB20508.1 hypothetical protein E6R27_20545 [Providencia sp. MGF014]HEJ9424969.1 hypothetical protein [Proteus mirabilis]ELI9034673.1 hypothetical protein [Morganella morganii]